MMYLTRAQRVALKRIYDRGETCSTCYQHIYIAACDGVTCDTCHQKIESGSDYDCRSYLAFRRTVEGLIGGQGCVMVPCGGIWFGVETDGYTHT